MTNKEWEREFGIRFIIKELGQNEPTVHCHPDLLKEYISSLLETQQEQIMKEVSSKVVLYVDSNHTHTELSHEDRLKLNADEVVIYLGDSTKKVWGDDWNDAPDDCNSGTPYSETIKGLQIIKVQLGKPLALIQKKMSKWTKGMRFQEWVFKPMDEENITTARVFMVSGFTLGLIAGACLLGLIVLL